ncbi:hypothetical protein BDP55DRAFT_629385 [Colletotrichum godetiae]|uniref:Uncharacterized protein n=1 Tax=Colletotrichum godetiae TaxID=1209918 RepID=A0AAJ0AU19_9PEZI|nr:uncharacterized protein BDP55DRAFT_629385 [Colletotrichum godetiae]KAK1688835.1 hypothetical protein BDP55DRAFT_629385 [Colletotrichum godetiae]
MDLSVHAHKSNSPGWAVWTSLSITTGASHPLTSHSVPPKLFTEDIKGKVTQESIASTTKKPFNPEQKNIKTQTWPHPETNSRSSLNPSKTAGNGNTPAPVHRLVSPQHKTAPRLNSHTLNGSREEIPPALLVPRPPLSPKELLEEEEREEEKKAPALTTPEYTHPRRRKRRRRIDLARRVSNGRDVSS